MKKKTEEYVWVRMGDMDSYHKFDDVAGAIDEMKENGVHGPMSWGPFGVRLICGGFEGDNHISIFWGDQDANFIRDLNDEEKK